MSDRAPAALIEFVEKGAPEGTDIRKVNEVRINGVPVLVSRAHDIEIHGVIDTDEPVMVTLTLFASEIRIGGSDE